MKECEAYANHGGPNHLMCRRSGELQETRVGASAKASRYHIHRVFQVRSSSSCHQCRFGPGGQSASQAEEGCASIGSTCIESLTVACFIIAAASVHVPGIVAFQGQRRYPHPNFAACPSIYLLGQEGIVSRNVCAPDHAREEVSEAGEPRWRPGLWTFTGVRTGVEAGVKLVWVLAWNL